MARETSVGVAMPPRAPPIIFHIPSLPYARPRSTPVAGTCLSRSRARRARPWRQPVTARTADENRGSCGRRFPQALSRLNPAPDADHYSLMWSVTIPLAVLTPCSRSTLTHRRASVPTRLEGLKACLGTDLLVNGASQHHIRMKILTPASLKGPSLDSPSFPPT